MVTRLEIVEDPDVYTIDHWNKILRECRTLYDASAWIEYMTYNSRHKPNTETHYILHQISQMEKNNKVKNYPQYNINNGQNIFNSFYPESP